MPPHPASRSCAGGDRSVRDRLPRPGPSGLGLGSRSSPVAGPSRSGDGDRSSPLLRERGTTTSLVRSIPSTWIGMIPFGLFFASSGSSTIWRNRQV